MAGALSRLGALARLATLPRMRQLAAVPASGGIRVPGARTARLAELDQT